MRTTPPGSLIAALRRARPFVQEAAFGDNPSPDALRVLRDIDDALDRKPTWFETVWEYLSETQREGVRAWSRRTGLTLPGALLDTPVLAPPALRHLIPGAAR